MDGKKLLEQKYSFADDNPHGVKHAEDTLFWVQLLWFTGPIWTALMLPLILIIIVIKYRTGGWMYQTTVIVH